MIVDSNMDIEQLFTLICDNWRVEPPNLLLSVTGGALNFPMTPRLKNAFRHGLVKAAKNTGTALPLRKVNC